MFENEGSMCIILKYLQQHNLIHNKQYEYRRQHSTSPSYDLPPKLGQWSSILQEGYNSSIMAMSLTSTKSMHF